MKFLLISLIIFFSASIVSASGQENLIDDPLPVLIEPNLKIEKFVSGLDWPTTMTFVDNDILVLEKNNGFVRHIKNGVLQEKPVLDVEVNGIGTTGLLGITSKGSEVYLFFTEAVHDGGEIIGNHIYKYSWDGHELTNGILIRKISQGDIGPEHHGGPMITHIDGTVYTVTGNNNQKGRNQNFPSGKIDDTSAIFAVDQVGKHYAIGIRNSFGLAVDPLTGNIWDTENGPNAFDEINLVLPKSNSGWEKIMGPASEDDVASLPSYDDFFYSDPEFSFEFTIAITGISFVESDLFPEYTNSILVGDFKNGNLYRFNLNEDRTGFVFDDPLLADLVANTGDPMTEIIMGTGFSGITDIKVGPDGLIYIISIVDGAIYRIIPSEQDLDDTSLPNCSSKPGPKVNLSGCDLSGSILDNTDFTFANLTNTNFSGASLSNSILSHSNLAGADLRGANLSNAQLLSAKITNAKLQGADLSGAKMRLTIFDGTDLENVKMKSADMEDAKFYQANLMNADLTKTNMWSVILINTNLVGANLSYADLTYAKFIESNLQEASLLAADIYRTNFSGSDLSGANLLGVYPYSTDFRDVIFSEETKTDSCLATDLSSRALNRALRELRQLDFFLLDPLESLIVQICRPS